MLKPNVATTVPTGYSEPHPLATSQFAAALQMTTHTSPKFTNRFQSNRRHTWISSAILSIKVIIPFSCIAISSPNSDAPCMPRPSPGIPLVVPTQRHGGWRQSASCQSASCLSASCLSARYQSASCQPASCQPASCRPGRLVQIGEVISKDSQPAPIASNAL